MTATTTTSTIKPCTSCGVKCHISGLDANGRCCKARCQATETAAKADAKPTAQQANPKPQAQATKPVVETPKPAPAAVAVAKPQPVAQEDRTVTTPTTTDPNAPRWTNTARCPACRVEVAKHLLDSTGHCTRPSCLKARGKATQPTTQPAPEPVCRGTKTDGKPCTSTIGTRANGYCPVHQPKVEVQVPQPQVQLVPTTDPYLVARVEELEAVAIALLDRAEAAEARATKAEERLATLEQDMGAAVRCMDTAQKAWEGLADRLVQLAKAHNDRLTALEDAATKPTPQPQEVKPATPPATQPSPVVVQPVPAHKPSPTNEDAERRLVGEVQVALKSCHSMTQMALLVKRCGRVSDPKDMGAMKATLRDWLGQHNANG